MVVILDGKKVRDEIAKTLRAKVEAFSSRPVLAIIQIGNQMESDVYILRKKHFAEAIGADVLHLRFAEHTSGKELRTVIEGLNTDHSVHGILLQLPIPGALDRQTLIDAITPEKDVDGLTATQRARRLLGEKDAIMPATARGIVELLECYHRPIRGQKAAVLGRSALVGAPTAEALRGRGAMVTVCHSKTLHTENITRASDIIIVAIGKPKFVGSEYFRDDATQTVVDVGITALRSGQAVHLEEEIPQTRLVGDVDFEHVKEMVAAISPVPGGVGPMTVAALFENLVSAYDIQTKSLNS